MKTSLRKLICVGAFIAGGILRAADVEPPVPVRTIAPDYPEDLRRSGTSGIVVVSCEVDDKGAVGDIKVAKSTNEAFDKAAVAAVEKWKFRPAQKDGKPVSARIQVPVKFSTVD